MPFAPLIDCAVKTIGPGDIASGVGYIVLETINTVVEARFAELYELHSLSDDDLQSAQLSWPVSPLGRITWTPIK